LFLKGRTTENVTVIDGVAFFGENRKSNSDQNFVKCIYKKQIYETRNYSRSKKWNNSVLQLTCKKIVQIINIIIMPTGCHFAVTVLNVEKVVLREKNENTDLLSDMTNNIIHGKKNLLVSSKNIFLKYNL